MKISHLWYATENAGLQRNKRCCRVTADSGLVKMTAGLFKSPGGHFFRFYWLSEPIEQPEANALRQGQNKK